MAVLGLAIERLVRGFPRVRSPPCLATPSSLSRPPCCVRSSSRVHRQSSVWQSSVWQSSVWDALEDNAPQVNLEDVTVKEASDVSKYMGVNADGVETTFDLSTGGADLMSELDNVQVWQSSVWYGSPRVRSPARLAAPASRDPDRARSLTRPPCRVRPLASTGNRACGKARCGPARRPRASECDHKPSNKEALTSHQKHPQNEIRNKK